MLVAVGHTLVGADRRKVEVAQSSVGVDQSSVEAVRNLAEVEINLVEVEVDTEVEAGVPGILGVVSVLWVY